MSILMDLVITTYPNHNPPPGEYHYKKMDNPDALEAELLQIPFIKAANSSPFSRSLDHEGDTIGFPVLYIEDSEEAITAIALFLGKHPELQAGFIRAGDFKRHPVEPLQPS